MLVRSRRAKNNSEKYSRHIPQKLSFNWAFGGEEIAKFAIHVTENSIVAKVHLENREREFGKREKGKEKKKKKKEKT